MSLTGGLFSFNRFDEFEKALNKSLEEGENASSPEKMRGAVRKAAADSKKKGAELKVASEKSEKKSEAKTADIDEEYKDVTKPTKLGGVSPQMKASARAMRLDATEPGSKRAKTQMKRSNQLNKLVHSGANMARRNEEVENVEEATYGGEPKPEKKDGKMLVTNVDKKGGTPAYANMKAGDKRYKAADHMKEGTEGAGENLVKRELNKDENNSKLKVTKKIMENENRMAMYSRALGIMGAHYSGLVEKKSEDKKADKDYDGDGKVESSKDEYFGSKDKAIKKAMGKKTDEEDEKEDVKEGVLTKEDVVAWLVAEDYASNEVSAEILHTHMSDEFLAEIEERMLNEEE